jgi:predicted permease
MPLHAPAGDWLRTDASAAWRSLLATPAATMAAFVLLAVAVGLNLGIFGLIDRAILSPAAHVVEPERVFTMGFEIPARPGGSGAPARMTTTNYVAFTNVRDNVPAVAGAAAWRRTSTSAAIDGEQVPADAMIVTGSYFDLLRVRARSGRTLHAEDDRTAAAAPVAVLSYGFWRAAFAGDPSILTRRLSLGGIDYAIVGVMPAGFSGHSSVHVDVWVPMAAAMRDVPGWDRDQFRNAAAIVVRLTPGESAASASAQASAVLERRASLAPLSGGEVAQTERRIAYALAGVSILVLVIGLANTATLLLVRASRRRRDAAIRSALGASRSRLFAHAMLEAAMLAIAATSVAIVLSYWFDEAIRRLLFSSVAERSGATSRTMAASAIAGLVAFALASSIGLASLPRAVRSEDLAGSGRGRRRSKAHSALLVVQTMLSVVLIVGAGLFARSLLNLVRQDFGMRLDDVLLVQFEQGPGRSGLSQILSSAVERVRLLPGVSLATPVQTMPFTGFHVIPVGVPGRNESPSVDGQMPYLLAATPELFDVLGIEIVHGRRFTAADERGAPVVIVNETMARGTWPGANAIGKCIRIGFDESFDPFTAAGPPGPPTSVPCREIVGVARDIRQRSVVPTGNEARLMQYFVPFSQVPPPPGRISAEPMLQGILVKAHADADSLVTPIRRAVLDGRTDLPFLNVRPYMQLLERQMQPWRLGTMLLAIFGALALGVSALGLYAAFAHTVLERRREMAIRIAIGARPHRVLLMVLRESSTIAIVGVACGSIVAALAGRTVESMLFGIVPADPLVLVGAAAIMIVVATLATIVPARTASRADPIALLRVDH